MPSFVAPVKGNAESSQNSSFKTKTGLSQESITDCEIDLDRSYSHSSENLAVIERKNEKPKNNESLKPTKRAGKAENESENKTKKLKENSEGDKKKCNGGMETISPKKEKKKPIKISKIMGKIDTVSSMQPPSQRSLPSQTTNSLSTSLANTEVNCSQMSNLSTTSQNSRRMVLSQPPRQLTQRDRLQWLQERRQVGIWVECSVPQCRKWRYLPQVQDPLEIPDKWFCDMNPDKSRNSCSKAEYVLNVREEEDLIHSRYSAGSLVWAQLHGFPWWPAMVDDCPDTEQYYWLDGFSDIPNYFNVTFFDSSEVTRAWVAPEKIKPYYECGKKIKNPDNQTRVPVKMERRIKFAKEQADNAMQMTVIERLRKYSFIARFKGPINKPLSFKQLKEKKIIQSFSDCGSSDSSESDNESCVLLELTEIINQVQKPNSEQIPNSGVRSRKKVDNKNKKINPKTPTKSWKTVGSEMTIINDSQSGSKSFSTQRSDEIPLQSLRSFAKNLSPKLKKTPDISPTISVHLNHSNSFVDLESCQQNECSQVKENETEQETEERIFHDLIQEDAIVPSTETNVIEMDYNEDQNSEKSLNFDLF